MRWYEANFGRLYDRYAVMCWVESKPYNKYQPEKLQKCSHYAIILPHNRLQIAILFCKTWQKFWHARFVFATNINYNNKN